MLPDYQDLNGCHGNQDSVTVGYRYTSAIGCQDYAAVGYQDAALGETRLMHLVAKTVSLGHQGSASVSYQDFDGCHGHQDSATVGYRDTSAIGCQDSATLKF